MVVFGQSGCIWAKVVVFGQTKLYSGKSGFIRANYCFPANVVVIEQKSLYSGKSGCNLAKWLYLRESGIFGQSF